MLRVQRVHRRDDLLLLLLLLLLFRFLLLGFWFFFFSSLGRQKRHADSLDENHPHPLCHHRLFLLFSPLLPPPHPFPFFRLFLVILVPRAPPLPRYQHPSPRTEDREPPREPSQAHPLEDGPCLRRAEERRRRGRGVVPSSSTETVKTPPVMQPGHVVCVRVREEEGRDAGAARRARPPAVDGDEGVGCDGHEHRRHRFRSFLFSLLFESLPFFPLFLPRFCFFQLSDGSTRSSETVPGSLCEREGEERRAEACREAEKGCLSSSFQENNGQSIGKSERENNIKCLVI